MFKRTLVLISALALCALCASQAFAKDMTIRGKLRKTVEHGGWLIVVEKQKYLILNSQKFAGEKWFAEGNEVEATGEVKTGVMTIYMEGIPFQVRSMRPFEQSGPDTDGVTSRGLARVNETIDFGHRSTQISTDSTGVTPVVETVVSLHTWLSRSLQT